MYAKDLCKTWNSIPLLFSGREVPVIFDIFVSHINSIFIRLLKHLEIQYSETRIETKGNNKVWYTYMPFVS